ncbi:MAG: OB-fold nucleic acid binding domain-containing protein, partial [Patescibacteria group bacterium]
KIRFGLTAIKNLSGNAINSIIEKRKEGGYFKNIQNFLEIIPASDLNKKSLEALIKCGALDCFNERRLLLINIEELLRYIKDLNKNNNTSQIGLFESFKALAPLNLIQSEPASKKEKLSWEKELLGLYTSEHPTSEYQEIMEKRSLLIAKVKPALVGQKTSVGGLISEIKKHVTKTGKLMLFTKIEDWANKIEVVVFPDLLEKNPEIWTENKIVIVSGRVDNRDGNLKIICESAKEFII